MSIDVAIEDLEGVIAERGSAAYFVTVRGTRPHVVAVTVAIRDGELVVGAGRRSARNIAERPEVTLLWPTTETHPKHTLLVDGRARASDDAEWLVITPTSAILHRAGGRRRALGDAEDLPSASADEPTTPEG